MRHLSTPAMTAVYVGLIIANVGQVTTLDCFLTALGSNGGPYFVLWLCSLLFNMTFWPMTWLRRAQGKITPAMDTATRTKGIHIPLVLIGLCNALNGLLLVYSCIPSRVPNDLQSVLLQAGIPITLICSWKRIGVLNKSYNTKQICGAVIVMAGIFIALIPTLRTVASDSGESQFQSGSWWGLVLVLSCLPMVLMNVFEERVFNSFEGYDMFLLLAWESFYQFLFMSLLFAVDWIPDFGLSSSASTWWTTFSNGFLCWFYPPSAPTLSPDAVDDGTASCNEAGVFGIVFTLCYVMTYVLGAVVMDYRSANLNTLILSVSNPVSSLFWIALKPVRVFCGGLDITSVEMEYALGSIPVIIIGTLIFQLYEKDKHDESPVKSMFNGKKKSLQDDEEEGTRDVDPLLGKSGREKRLFV